MLSKIVLATTVLFCNSAIGLYATHKRKREPEPVCVSNSKRFDGRTHGLRHNWAHTVCIDATVSPSAT